MNREAIVLPVSEVANTVVVVNPAFNNLPLKLAVGEKSNLGIFFDDNENSKPRSVEVDPTPKSFKGRAGVLGRFVFKDEDGNSYRDLLAKGIGFFTVKFDFWAKHTYKRKHQIDTPERNYSVQGT